MQQRLHLTKADITKMKVDAIVNAANPSLMGGGGVDGAIHRAGGPVIIEECRKIVATQGNCGTGEAVITTGGKLPVRHVIHTVGPVWKNGKMNESKLLANCYRNSLQLAIEHNLKSIAFPNISTGVYGYPKKEAADVAVDTVMDFLKACDAGLTVYFVCFDDENYSIYKGIFNQRLLNTETFKITELTIHV